MSEANTNFDTSFDKYGSAIDEPLFNRIVSLLNCQSDPDGKEHDLDINSREKMFEHFDKSTMSTLLVIMCLMILCAISVYLVYNPETRDKLMSFYFYWVL